MPKAIKKRISKKPSKAETEVKDKLISLQDRIKEQKKKIVLYGSIFIVTVIAVAGFFLYDYSSRKKARTLSYEAYKIYHHLYQKQPENKEVQFKKALDMFKESYDTRKSPIALLYIANSYYELSKYDEALKTLKDFTKRYSREEKFIPLAYHKMAMAYIKKGNAQEAMKTLETLYHLEGDIYKDFALMEHAQLLEREGRKEEAKRKYKELSERFPDSPFSDEAKAKLSADRKEG